MLAPALRARLVLPAVLALCMLLLSTPGLAGGPGAAAVSAADANAWLARINTAANQRSYRGTMVFSADGVVSSSRVAHACVGELFIERVESLDGRQHRVYRHNELVHTVWPQEKVVVVERRDATAGLVSTRRTVEPRALEQYRMTVLDRRRVAGRMARVLMLEPKDDLRFAHRLWADEETALLLRTDVLGPDGRVLESSAFSEIDIGLRGRPEALLEGMSPAGYRVLPSPTSSTDLASEGWQLRAEVPGFRLMGCLRRPPPDGGQGAMLHAIFSDGLSFVSVFVEPFDEVRHARALSAHLGATRTLMQRDGAYWVTAMGDVPQLTLEHFVRVLERRR